MSNDAPPPYSADMAGADGFQSVYTDQQSQSPYPTQQYPAQGAYGQQPVPPPVYAADMEKKDGFAPAPTNYQTQYVVQPGGYYGQPIQGQPQMIHVVPIMTNPPDSHMLFSVLTTLCCCWPIGLFAIMKSLEVSNAIARGDRDAAVQNSTRAYQLAKYAAIAGVICTVIMVLFLIIFYAFIFTNNFGLDMD